MMHQCFLIIFVNSSFKNIHEYFFMMNAQGAVGGWGGEC